VLNTMAVSELFYSSSLVSYSLDGVVLSELTVNLVGKIFWGYWWLITEPQKDPIKRSPLKQLIGVGIAESMNVVRGLGVVLRLKSDALVGTPHWFSGTKCSGSTGRTLLGEWFHLNVHSSGREPGQPGLRSVLQ